MTEKNVLAFVQELIEKNKVNNEPRGTYANGFQTGILKALEAVKEYIEQDEVDSDEAENENE